MENTKKELVRVEFHYSDGSQDIYEAERLEKWKKWVDALVVLGYTHGIKSP